MVELCELSEGPDVVKYIKLKRLQWASRIVRMDSTRIPRRKVLNGTCHGNKLVGRPPLRWEHIRRDFLAADE